MKQIKILIALACMLSVSNMSCMSPDEKGKQLARAALDSDAKKIQKLLAEGADVNYLYKMEHGSEYSPLMLAGRMAEMDRQYDIVKMLLKTPGIDVNLRNQEGHTALHEAVIDFNIEFLKLLINVPHIDVNLKNNNGRSPLDIAIGNGFIKLILLLIPYSNKETLQNLPQKTVDLLDPNMQEFIAWFKKGSQIKGLLKEQLIPFTQVAFAMPALVEEFKQLIKASGLDDFDTIFTKEVVDKAHNTHNIEAFEALFKLARNDKRVADRIRKMQVLIGKTPQDFPRRDIGFSFE